VLDGQEASARETEGRRSKKKSWGLTAILSPARHDSERKANAFPRAYAGFAISNSNPLCLSIV
jgi:hypothetical protein